MVCFNIYEYVLEQNKCATKFGTFRLISSSGTLCWAHVVEKRQCMFHCFFCLLWGPGSPQPRPHLRWRWKSCPCNYWWVTWNNSTSRLLFITRCDVVLRGALHFCLCGKPILPIFSVGIEGFVDAAVRGERMQVAHLVLTRNCFRVSVPFPNTIFVLRLSGVSFSIRKIHTHLWLSCLEMSFVNIVLQEGYTNNEPCFTRWVILMHTPVGCTAFTELGISAPFHWVINPHSGGGGGLSIRSRIHKCAHIYIHIHTNINGVELSVAESRYLEDSW